MGLEAEKVFFETTCGIEICDLCQKELPYENALIPLKHEIYEEEYKIEK